jgi:hypothetical protein
MVATKPIGLDSYVFFFFFFPKKILSRYPPTPNDGAPIVTAGLKAGRRQKSRRPLPKFGEGGCLKFSGVQPVSPPKFSESQPRIKTSAEKFSPPKLYRHIRIRTTAVVTQTVANSLAF